MSAILDQVKLYMSQAIEGKSELSDELANEFGEVCKALIKRHFEPRKNDFSIRMSSVGRPLCQQQLEMAGAPRKAPPYEFMMQMLIGDLVEAAAYTIMKGAGVLVTDYQKPVSLDIGGIKLNGTIDLKVNGQGVFDIKSASPYSFDNKFNSIRGFAAIREDDPFGYIPQAYLYAEAEHEKFGGWIVVNKSTGEWAILEH